MFNFGLATTTLVLCTVAVRANTVGDVFGDLKRELCQFPTRNALTGCPAGTIYVSQTDSKASFNTIQGALDSLANATTPQTLLIGAGTYNETVKIYAHTNLTLLGQTKFPASVDANKVEVVHSVAIIAIPGQSNINSSTVQVDGPPRLSVYNLNLTNSWPSTNHSAALAIGLNQGNTSFHATSFKSYQDTLYVGSKANAFFEACEVRGQTDFIFGQGRAWFEKASIGIRQTGDLPRAGIVAWQGAEGTTKGAYLRNSRIGLAPDHNTTTVFPGTMALGRPWNNFSVTIYMQTYMGSVVNASGFTAWAGKVFDNVTYAEYGSYGPGYVPAKRILSQETLGSAREGNALYNYESVFGDELPSWFF